MRGAFGVEDGAPNLVERSDSVLCGEVGTADAVLEAVEVGAGRDPIGRRPQSAFLGMRGTATLAICVGKTPLVSIVSQRVEKTARAGPLSSR